MKIISSGMPGGSRVEHTSRPSLSSQVSGSTRSARKSPETLITRLSAIFSQKGINVAPSIVQALEAELAALGMGASNMDSDVAFRALLLHRNNIPLTSELLRGGFEEESTVFHRLGTLQESARALLADARITGENRTALEMFIKDIDSLFKILEQKVMGNSAVNLADRGVDVILAEDGVVFPVREMLRNSGMMFEWRLLAWYRSGGNPERLYELIHQDVKGILTGLVKRLKSRRTKGRAQSRISALERDTQSLLDSITSRQISNILQNRGDRREFYMEIPFGDASGRGDARIWANSRKKSDEDMLDPAHFNLTFDVETTGLGRVYVIMNAVDETVSLRFSLGDKKSLELAREMQGELTDSLEARGFRVGSVAFDILDDDEAQGRRGRHKRSVDIVG